MDDTSNEDHDLRFMRLYHEAKRQGVAFGIYAAPTDSTAGRSLSQFRPVGAPADLSSQLDVVEGYLTGLRWRDIKTSAQVALSRPQIDLYQMLAGMGVQPTAVAEAPVKAARPAPRGTWCRSHGSVWSKNEPRCNTSYSSGMACSTGLGIRDAKAALDALFDWKPEGLKVVQDRYGCADPGACLDGGWHKRDYDRAISRG